MNKYNIVVLESAIQDLIDLSNTISFVYKSPRTSVKYIRNLKSEIAKLSHSAENYAIQTRPFFRQYGFNVRRINYNRMAIIYTVHEDVVYIQRIIPASMITGL